MKGNEGKRKTTTHLNPRELNLTSSGIGNLCIGFGFDPDGVGASAGVNLDGFGGSLQVERGERVSASRWRVKEGTREVECTFALAIVA